MLRTTDRPPFLASLVVVTVAAAAGAQAPAVTDPSPHTVRFVTVKDGTRLEVLDWGGTGRPLVLLAGYQTAHQYDDFAPRLRGSFRVYGITRRGYGASGAPEAGYTALESADDVLQVLDALKLDAPVIAGHSFGGMDATTIATEHPTRLSALVYLNAAEDPTLTLADYGFPPPKHAPPAQRPAPAADRSSFAAFRGVEQQRGGVALPESELRQVFAANADGSVGAYLPPSRVRDAIFKGRRKPAYDRIRVPVLSFVPAPVDAATWIAAQRPASDADAAAWQERYEGARRIYQRHRDDLKRGARHSKEIELPGGNFYIFLSHPDEIARELAAFARTLPPAAKP